MIQSRVKGLGRRFALLTALMALTASVGASAAVAAPTVAPSTGVAWTGESVVVSGVIAEVPTGTEHVAIVLCKANTTFRGENCDPASSSFGFKAVSEYLGGVISIPVRRGAWTNFDYSKGSPPTELGSTTTCYSEEVAKEEEDDEGEQCEMVVSFYKTVNGKPVPLGTALPAPITFE